MKEVMKLNRPQRCQIFYPKCHQQRLQVANHCMKPIPICTVLKIFPFLTQMLVWLMQVRVLAVDFLLISRMYKTLVATRDNQQLMVQYHPLYKPLYNRRPMKMLFLRTICNPTCSNCKETEVSND